MAVRFLLGAAIAVHAAIWLIFSESYARLATQPPLFLFGVATLALFVVAARRGEIAITGTSPQRTRVALVAAATLAVALGFAKRWENVSVQSDTTSYLVSSPIRPPLYPAFLHALDRQRGATTWPMLEPTGEPRPAPDHRFLRAAQAQKVLTAIALATMLVAATELVNAWLAVALVAIYALVDLYRLGGDSSIWWNADALMSEGLDEPLVFFLFASLFFFIARATIARGIATALFASLLLLTRASNGLLVLALVPLFLIDREKGTKRALGRAAIYLGVFALPLAIACARNARDYGRFRLHAFSGLSTFSVALQAADASDVDAFDDARVRDFLRICIVDDAALRVRDYRDDPRGDYVNVNLYEIAEPAFERVWKPAHEERPWLADDVLSPIARALIARHARAYLGMVAFQLARAFRAIDALALVAFAAALALYVRTRERELLAAVFFAAAPFLALAPAFFVNFPSERYRSQLGFAEHLALPFFLALLATKPELARWRKNADERLASSP